MRALSMSALCLVSVLAACGPKPAAPEPQAVAAKPAAPCPDDGPRFAATGLCTGRISNYYDPEALLPEPRIDAPAGRECRWAFVETPMIDEALIYRAVACKDGATNLDFGAGAHRAGLFYKTSAFFKDVKPDTEVAKIFLASDKDPQSPLKERIAELPPAERAKCVIKPANIQGWPKDALWITYNDDAAKSLSKGEVNAVCGEYGMDEDSQRFWLVRQGYAFFFDLGQEQSDIDPASFLVFAKGADGTWAPKQ